MIVGHEVPDHTVIARFRKRHRKEFEALFVEVLKLCHAAGLVRLGVVALDGSKIKANAALSANRTARSWKQKYGHGVGGGRGRCRRGRAVWRRTGRRDTRREMRDPSDRPSRLRACLDRLRAEAHAQAACQQEKIDARAAEEKATGKAKHGRKPKPAEETVADDAKANVTDPASRIMKDRKGYLQGYNAQAVVTTVAVPSCERCDA